MQRKLKSVLLLDDNVATNFLHKKAIVATNCAENVYTFQSGYNALEYIKSIKQYPELIFVDINMPIMNSWEFIEKYQKLELYQQHKTVIILLTTSLSPKDKKKANSLKGIKHICLKPLKPETLQNVLNRFFPEMQT